ncbi:MAG: hypothetical protein WAV46_03845 [Candidatus Moraniibacteriota bacterium]
MKNLLHSKKIGALLRVFAKKPEFVSGAVAQTLELAEKFLTIAVDGQPIVRHIEILIPRDEGYSDVDCGETAKALRIAIDLLSWAKGRIFVSEVKHGDLFCGILNYGMARLSRAGCDYGIIASKEAGSYFNQTTAEAIVQAAEDGALAIGVALNELTESIMEGRIANTMAMWHITSLLQVGGFDLRAAKPKKNAIISHKVRAWDKSRDEPDWTYDLAGVEEIIPLVRLIDTFGQCIAPILPQGDDVQRYIVPDPAIDRVGYERHINKMGTKKERHTYFANSEGADLSFLKGGVMESYRHPDY